MLNIEQIYLTNYNVQIEHKRENMRGSIYYQTALLTKVVFHVGLSKEDKVNCQNIHYAKVASFQTMDSYRRVWNNIGLFLQRLGIKDFEQITQSHIESYINYKLQKKHSQKYLQKISAALGKLEFALQTFSKSVSKKEQNYDFSIRQVLLTQAVKDKEVYDGYHNRYYHQVDSIIENLSPHHRIFARAQVQSGIRVEALIRLQHMNFIGKRLDPGTKEMVYTIQTKEKGGKVGDAYLTKGTYYKLKKLKQQGYALSYQAYAKDIVTACKIVNMIWEGSHGFRWTFARNRLRTYQEHGFSYDGALQEVSYEMKHNRASIAEHYIGKKQS